MRHAGHEPASSGSLTGRGSRSPWGHADGPGRMAPRHGPRRARQPHAGAAAGPSARIEPGREHLAVSAQQLVVEPRVRLLPRHRRSLLRRLEPPHRPALDHHVHRPPGLGQCMRISAGWYKAARLNPSRCSDVHGPAVIWNLGHPNGPPDYTLNHLWPMLESTPGPFAYSPTKDWRWIRSGTAEGTLIGGNLISVQCLLGTPYEPDWSGTIFSGMT